MASAVVLSDTHFGLGSSTLAVEKNVDYLIWEVWRYGGGCDEVVLLGDIFDLWRARPEKAIRDARYLLSRLDDLGLKMSYIVGNHDHHMTIMNQEEDFLERVARGDIYSVYSPNLSWCQMIDGINIDMHYPTYSASFCGKSFLFTHGHHLDGAQAFSVQVVEALRKLHGAEITPADLEMMMAYTYESIYRSSYIGEIVELEERLWKVSSLFQKVKTGILGSLRYTPIERQYEAIQKFIKERGCGHIDCFVYGDTHRAGVCSRSGGPLAVNAGSLACDGRSDEPPCDEVVPNTYMVMGDDGVAVRQLGKGEPLYSSPYP